MTFHQKFGNHWSGIASAIHKSTSNKIKNRFYTMFRKVKNKIKRDDMTCQSEVELLEMYYVISIIEDYANSIGNPTASLDSKNKDYICKLVQDLEVTQVKSYKEELYETHRKSGSMKELFAKMMDCNDARSNHDKKKRVEDKKEGLECNRLEFLDVHSEARKNLLTLPPLNSWIDPHGGISPRDKEGIWASVFNKKCTLSTILPPLSVFSSSVTMSNQSQMPFSADFSNLKREDECHGFSQFASEFESRPNTNSVFALPSLGLSNQFH
jgi:hypothetical protein